MKVVVFLLFVVMVISTWLFPSTIPALGISILLFSLAIAMSSIFKKHREAYLQGKVTRVIFARNVLVEIFGILLAMTLAGLLGRTIVQIVTEQIHSDSIKLITGIIIGLLVGISVGILIKRAWGRVVKL